MYYKDVPLVEKRDLAMEICAKFLSFNESEQPINISSRVLTKVMNKIKNEEFSDDLFDICFEEIKDSLLQSFQQCQMLRAKKKKKKNNSDGMKDDRKTKRKYVIQPKSADTLEKIVSTTNMPYTGKYLNNDLPSPQRERKRRKYPTLDPEEEKIPENIRATTYVCYKIDDDIQHVQKTGKKKKRSAEITPSTKIKAIVEDTKGRKKSKSFSKGVSAKNIYKRKKVKSENTIKRDMSLGYLPGLTKKKL
jgi:hypothetical protein